MDPDNLDILAEIPITDIDKFYNQHIKAKGKLKVFNIVGNFPYSFHILSNFGIYIYNFQTNLTNIHEVMWNPKTTLVPVSTRIIRVTYDKYNSRVASNEYGYAFLVRKNTARTDFEIYLGVVSFYQGMNS